MVHDQRFKDKELEMEELDIWGKPVSPALNEFKWALKTLRAGGKVRRATWAEGSYIYVNEHGILMFYLTGTRLTREIPHQCDWQDLSAIDWQAFAG